MQIVLIARAEPTRQTEPALGMAMLAYNLMSLFRQAVMKSGKHHPLATLHHKVFAVGAFWDSSAEKNVLWDWRWPGGGNVWGDLGLEPQRSRSASVWP